MQDNPNVLIEPAGKETITIIQAIVHRTWPVTYGVILDTLQIDYMLDLFYSDKALIEQMEHGHLFYLLKQGIHAVGFIDIENCIEKDSSDNYCKLHKIYLLPEFQGMRYGQKLIQFAIDWTLEAGAKRLRLNVNRENPALGFYQKLGFVILEKQDIAIGNNYFMNDFLMELNLK